MPVLLILGFLLFALLFYLVLKVIAIYTPFFPNYLRVPRERYQAKKHAKERAQKEAAVKAALREELKQLPAEELEPLARDYYECQRYFREPARKYGFVLTTEECQALVRRVLEERKTAEQLQREKALAAVVRAGLDRLSPEELRRVKTDEGSAFTAFITMLLREYEYPITASELCEFVSRTLKQPPASS